MPGYEIFSADGTMILRMSRGTFEPIGYDELRQHALHVAAFAIDGSPSQTDGFMIKEFSPEEYKERIDYQRKNKKVIRFDGSEESIDEWANKSRAMSPKSNKPQVP